MTDLVFGQAICYSLSLSFDSPSVPARADAQVYSKSLPVRSGGDFHGSEGALLELSLTQHPIRHTISNGI